LGFAYLDVAWGCNALPWLPKGVGVCNFVSNSMSLSMTSS
jgi:hypothetical protein